MAKRGRPVGSGKATDEKFVLKSFKVPPELWAEFVAVVPKNERSARIRTYMEKEIRKQKK